MTSKKTKKDIIEVQPIKSDPPLGDEGGTDGIAANLTGEDKDTDLDKNLSNTKGKDGRDEKGKFVKGHNLSKGNSLAGYRNHVWQILKEKTTDDKIVKVLEALYKKASRGELGAIKEFNRLVFGEQANLLQIGVQGDNLTFSLVPPKDLSSDIDAAADDN